MRLRLLPVLALLLLLAASTTTPAGAASPTLLPLNGAGFLAVDDAHGHVFATGRPTFGGNDKVAVLNTDGTLATTITGVAGAAGLAVSGGKLYVARVGTTTIAVYDTATLQQLETITPPRQIVVPGDLAVVDGRIWVGIQPASGTGSEPISFTVASPHVQDSLSTFDQGAGPV